MMETGKTDQEGNGIVTHMQNKRGHRCPLQANKTEVTDTKVLKLISVEWVTIVNTTITPRSRTLISRWGPCLCPRSNLVLRLNKGSSPFWGNARFFNQGVHLPLSIASFISFPSCKNLFCSFKGMPYERWRGNAEESELDLHALMTK